MYMKKTLAYIMVLSITVLAACSSPKKVKTEEASATTGATEQTSQNKDNDKMTQVLLKTTFGDIVIALYNDTPQHKANFVKLVNDKFYDGVLFHRIIKGFMIQGGDPDSKTAKPGQRLGSGDVGYTIPAEFVPAHIHKRGAVAAARMCQFYIVDGTVYDNDKLNMLAMRLGKTFTPEQVQAYTTDGGAPFLDGEYTVFGEVVRGMTVVDKIAAQQKDGADRPVEDIKIISATIME